MPTPKFTVKHKSTALNGRCLYQAVIRPSPFLHPLSQPTKSVSGPPYDATAHFHLLLADSALPLGSFAFSSGLESYLAHTTTTTKASSNSAASISFATFLPLSISSYASTTLPFLLAAHREPSSLPALDDALDAAVVCTVGKRASVAQGRALLGLWERSFAPNPSSSSPSSSSYCPSSSAAAMQALTSYASLLRTAAPASAASAATDDLPPPVAAHLAPLFGAVAHILGLSLAQTAYVFMLGHVKALVSAAVRASVLGPYAAQRVLAAAGTREMIGAAVAREWTTRPEEAGQGVPVMDLWIGRHEVLYSRIFNS
ncbi:unnamed protein product [Discula destructiva]